jgi:hypothetical protein
MNAGKRAHFAEILLEERARVCRTLGDIAVATPGVDSIVPGRAPGEDGEVGASGAAPGDDDAIIMREAAALDDIDEALRVLYEEPEHYGICARCGIPIDGARLEFIPSARFCERHSPS